jgi:hypothetical protein
VSGKITHVFGHRFVVRTDQGDVLADLTPKGLEQITLRLDDEVKLEGEMKPSELKVTEFTRSGKTVQLDLGQKPHADQPASDPVVVLAAARTAGFRLVGEPRRKPKHFEVLGQQNGEFHELHIELDGKIRKSKPVAKNDPKWAAELQAQAETPQTS